MQKHGFIAQVDPFKTISLMFVITFSILHAFGARLDAFGTHLNAFGTHLHALVTHSAHIGHSFGMHLHAFGMHVDGFISQPLEKADGLLQLGFAVGRRQFQV